MRTGYPLLDALIVVLTASASLWGAITLGRKTLAEARALKKPPPTPYDMLAQRVTALEQADADKGREIHRLRTQVRRLAGVMSREVAHVLEWIDRGAEPPPPEREVRVLREVIDDLEHDNT